MWHRALPRRRRPAVDPTDRAPSVRLKKKAIVIGKKYSRKIKTTHNQRLNTKQPAMNFDDLKIAEKRSRQTQFPK
jgi:hypothetical protein